MKHSIPRPASRRAGTSRGRGRPIRMLACTAAAGLFCALVLPTAALGAEAFAEDQPPASSETVWYAETPEPQEEPAAAPEPVGDPAPESDPAEESAPAPEPEPGALPDATPEPEPGAVPDATPEPQPGTVPDATPEPQPGTIPDPTPEPQPGTVPDATPEPQPGAVPDPTPEPQPGTAPDPTPEPQPTAAPDPAPTPRPTASPAKPSGPVPTDTTILRSIAAVPTADADEDASLTAALLARFATAETALGLATPESALLALNRCTVWLDGTDGGLMSLGGAANEKRTVTRGAALTLPTEFTGPAKYACRLNGWYDVNAAQWYEPGAEVVIQKNTVFYADWRPESYDIGRPGAEAVAALDTDRFITTRVFDYSALFNVMSCNAKTTIDQDSHSEVWTQTANPAYGVSAPGFVFRDWDTAGRSLSYPASLSETNTYHGDLMQGIYSAGLISLLFDPDRQVIGKTYVGTGNYLYQFDSETGCYYYDSEQNAASYNQSDGRFYLYPYLERTSDSAKDGGSGNTGYSDFLPFNSPYANTNGKPVATYTASGGLSGYQYDAKYQTGTNNAGASYWFGVSSTINFYLPKASDPNGGGSRSLRGDDLVFRFSGDDDVWVCVDGTLVLDLGGIHGVESGSINFTTGRVQWSYGSGAQQTRSFDAGEHTLTMYYLERGASQSNCSVRFNIAPREYTLQLDKADRDDPSLTLPGARFTVYSDAACTVPASGLRDQNDRAVPDAVFTTDAAGRLHCQGLLAGSTYYLKETQPPPGYNGSGNVVVEVAIGDVAQGYRITSRLLVDGQEVSLDSASNVWLEQDLSESGEQRILKYRFCDSEGCALPNTGGSGTTRFHLAGLGLLCAAGLALPVVRRKTNRKEDRTEQRPAGRNDSNQ